MPTPTEPTEPTEITPPRPQGERDVLASLSRLLERQGGDAGRVAELLYRENYELRERARTLSAAVPPEGAVVLPADAVATWQAYQALGTPDDVQAALATAQAAQQELAQARWTADVQRAAEALGWAAAPLRRLAEGLTIELRETTAGETTTLTPYVVSEAGAVPLAQYATQEWAEFLPALQVTAAPTGAAFVRQGTTTTAPTDPVAAFIAARNEARDKASLPLKRS